MATLSRIERDKQGLDLGLFLILCRILKTSAQELIGEEPEENVDPLAVRIANLQRTDRIQLWRDLAAARKNGRRTAARSQIRALSDEVEELLAQLEFVRTEMEAVHNHVRRGGGRP